MAFKFGSRIHLITASIGVTPSNLTFGFNRMTLFSLASGACTVGPRSEAIVPRFNHCHIKPGKRMQKVEHINKLHSSKSSSHQPSTPHRISLFTPCHRSWRPQAFLLPDVPPLLGQLCFLPGWQKSSSESLQICRVTSTWIPASEANVLVAWLTFSST